MKGSRSGQNKKYRYKREMNITEPKLLKCLLSLALIFAVTAVTGAQTTSFTYQGRLYDGSLPAEGTFDLRLQLYDAEGVPVSGAIDRPNVSVANGIFTVELEFGSSVFNGDDRYLEISVKKSAEAEFTLLAPKQRINSSPYSIRALNSVTADNAQNLGGIPAEVFVQDSDPRMMDSRDPNPGSGNYIQNSEIQQAASSFNVSGVGKASAFDAASHYRINGLRAMALMAPDNTFVGFNTGTNTVGGGNSFFGASSGTGNTSGLFNSFFGASAGFGNTTGSNNTFAGVQAGESNTAGGNNSFFGRFAGYSNISSSNNAFFGAQAGFSSIGTGNAYFGYRSGFASTSYDNNSFFGAEAGESATLGHRNTFVGYRAGRNNRNSGNTFIGAEAGMSNTTGSRNTFVGERAGNFSTTGSNNSIFGSEAGASNTASNNSFFGSNAGSQNNIGDSNSFFGMNAGQNNTSGNGNAFFGHTAGAHNQTGSNNSYFGRGAGVGSQGSNNVAVGSGSGNGNTTGTSNTYVGTDAGGNVSSGNRNTFIGAGAGNSAMGGNSNTLLGAFASASSGLSFATAIGSGANVSVSNAVVLGRASGDDRVFVPGSLTVNQLGTAGATSLCRNASNQISTCSSSLRYKTNIASFFSGLQIVRRLQPITFDWITDQSGDLGLGAEEVAEIEPLLVNYDSSGTPEGVKYDRIALVLVNAVKEQQAEIERQRKELEEQRAIINELLEVVRSREYKAFVGSAVAKEQVKKDEK